MKSCRSKLAEHYKRSATVPTSVWSKTSPVDIHQIYTRLSWVKEEQTPAGSSRSELKHYTDVFTANKNGVAPKRILVQGQTGIGKSTFVKKLAVDWAELDDETTEHEQKIDAMKCFEDDEDERKTKQDDEASSSEDRGEDTSSDEYEDMSSDEYEDTSSVEHEDTSSVEYEDTSSVEYEDTSSVEYVHLSSDEKYINEGMSENQKNALWKFELVLVVNLKEVPKCQSLQDVISQSYIFSEEETAMTEGILRYITKNQEKVLLVFDEYRCGSNSEIYEIFRGKKLKNCCVLITTRNSKADELRAFKDVHAEITGFSEEDRGLYEQNAW